MLAIYFNTVMAVAGVIKFFFSNIDKKKNIAAFTVMHLSSTACSVFEQTIQIIYKNKFYSSGSVTTLALATLNFEFLLS